MLEVSVLFISIQNMPSLFESFCYTDSNKILFFFPFDQQYMFEKNFLLFTKKKYVK